MAPGSGIRTMVIGTRITACSLYMASCLIAVDNATKENGCLQVIKGSHLMGRIDHNKTGDQTGADIDRVNEALKHLELVYCEMDPGTALFFHSNLLHSIRCQSQSQSSLVSHLLLQRSSQSM